MIPPELKARIRRLYYAEHWKVDTIATELGLHHTTVRRACERDSFASTGSIVRASALDPYKPFIQATLEQHPRLRATRLFAMVQSRGYPGSAIQVRRYVRTVRPVSNATAYLKLETLPGEQAQVDWAHFGKITVGHTERALSCFVFVLSWSRAMYARFTLDQTLESFLRGHVEAFHAVGGAPRAVLYDNLKSVVLDRVGDHIRFHPKLLDLAGHYHFAPRPCAPFRGNEKGRVERTIRYLRDAFFAARRFRSLDELNEQLARWVAEVAHQRKVPADPLERRVHQAWVEEQPRLLPLPEHPFESDLVRPCASGKTPYLRFDGNDYSIPHTLVRKPLTIVASETRVRILDGITEVACHTRSYDRRQTIEDAAHLESLAAAKRRAHELTGRQRLSAACPQAEAFLEALAQRGSAPLSADTRRLLDLLDRYGARELDAALATALERGALGAASVAHLLDQRARARRTPPPLDVVLPDRAQVRDLRVTPHSLKPYDQLLVAANTPDESTEDRDDDHSA